MERTSRMTIPDHPSQIPPEVLRGIERFNRGEFYACHQSLEKAWMQEKGAVRKLYQGILQIGVALYHEGTGNRKGATRLLQAGMDKLRDFAPTRQGIDIEAILDAGSCIGRYFQTNTERLPKTMHPIIHVIPSEKNFRNPEILPVK